MEYIVSIDDSSAGAVIIQLQSSNCGMYYRVIRAGYRPPEKYAISSKQQAETTRRENRVVGTGGTRGARAPPIF